MIASVTVSRVDRKKRRNRCGHARRCYRQPVQGQSRLPRRVPPPGASRHAVRCQTPPNVPVDANGRPRGDIDLDCDVDLADRAVFQTAFTGPLQPCDFEVCNNGVDDDSDTFVDCDDYDCEHDRACF